MATAIEPTAEAGLAAVLRSRVFEIAITILIVANAAVLGLETYPGLFAQYERPFELFNTTVLAIFVVEILLKMMVFGRSFWRDGWSWFDMAIIGVSLAPSAGGFAALRAFRAVRLLRLITFVPSLRRVVEGLIRALPGLGSIIVLLLLLLYVFSVISTRLYGETHPEFFGSLEASAFTLFTVMTLEGWPDVARSVMEQHPWSWLFFVVFIMLSSFAVLNLIIGVIVDAMQSQAEIRAERLEKLVDDEQDILMAEIGRLRAEIRQMRTERASGPPG
jgi:voltage-gated sodium channel